jgi:hypothetical protein
MIYGKDMVGFLLKNKKSNNKIIKKLIKETTNENVIFNKMIYIDIFISINNKSYISFFNEDHLCEIIESGKNKYNKYSINQDSPQQQFVKSGKFANSLGLKNLTNNDREEFSSLITSYNEYEIKIVSSIEDIKHFYNKDSYFKLTGSLGGSCMRSMNETVSKMLQLYVDNGVKLVVVKSPNDNTKIISRALLWDNVTIEYTNSKGQRVVKENQTFLDRIYTYSDNDTEILLKFAKKNGYIRKMYQSYNDKGSVKFPDGYAAEVLLKRTMDTTIKTYPYLDTFTYSDKFNEGDTDVIFHNNINAAWYKFIDYSNGVKSSVIIRPEYSSYLDEEIDSRLAVYSNIMESWLSRDDSVTINGDWCHIDEIIKINNIQYYKNGGDVTFSTAYNEYIIIKDTIEVMHLDKRTNIKIEDAVWDEFLETYVYKISEIVTNKHIVEQKSTLDYLFK